LIKNAVGGRILAAFVVLEASDHCGGTPRMQMHDAGRGKRSSGQLPSGQLGGFTSRSMQHAQSAVCTRSCGKNDPSQAAQRRPSAVLTLRRSSAESRVDD
jgi:hypothetical protein